ncbi:MAG: ABC transporter ATP-binding protein, partial [Gammaproteobacteria bacterium]|nr:ABC transporter ATP-binding protein [Gammaproteobacteria bacterium]
SLCRALIHNPDVLILDEPFGALDAFTREDLWLTMHKLRAEEPFTGVLITHDLRESIFLADEVVVLSDRPATVQHSVSLKREGVPSLDQLYTSDSIATLNELREQIRIARNGAEV